jgi:hypothetical protein
VKSPGVQSPVIQDSKMRPTAEEISRRGEEGAAYDSTASVLKARYFPSGIMRSVIDGGAGPKSPRRAHFPFQGWDLDVLDGRRPATSPSKRPGQRLKSYVRPDKSAGTYDGEEVVGCSSELSDWRDNGAGSSQLRPLPSSPSTLTPPP